LIKALVFLVFDPTDRSTRILFDLSAQVHRRRAWLVQNRKNRLSYQYTEHRAPLSFGQSGHPMNLFQNQSPCDEKAEEHLSLSEEMLVSAARAGQDWAFVELCSRNSRRILVTLRGITKNAQDAEDVLQESILKAFIHFREFNQTSSFSTWFTRININSALMLLRRRRTHPETSIDGMLDEDAQPIRWEVADLGPNPEDYYILSESHERLRVAISHLPKIDRRIFEVRYQFDGSVQEAAEDAGMSIGATKSRLLRARNTVRASFKRGHRRASLKSLSLE
jgi:RNA polymerase sigma-70 factor, ECF subfamily